MPVGGTIITAGGAAARVGSIAAGIGEATAMIGVTVGAVVETGITTAWTGSVVTTEMDPLIGATEAIAMTTGVMGR